MNAINLSDIIARRNDIARSALDGDLRYSHEAIGEDDGSINEMDVDIGMPIQHRAENDNDVAVYSDGRRAVLVCDANGPVAIEIL